MNIVQKNVNDLIPYAKNTKKHERRAFCMEFDPKFVDVIIARGESFTGEKAVLLND